MWLLQAHLRRLLEPALLKRPHLTVQHHPDLVLDLDLRGMSGRRQWPLDRQHNLQRATLPPTTFSVLSQGPPCSSHEGESFGPELALRGAEERLAPI